MSDLFHVSAAPHSRSPITTRIIMRDVLIALVPASLFGIYNFGINALLVMMTAIVACVMTEYIYCKLMKKPVTNGDYSAAVTGLLLALNLPVNMPYWMVIVGGIFAILIVKLLYGGLGQNFMNPALAARVFLLISFPARITDFKVQQIANPSLKDYLNHGAIAIDGVSEATPLAAMKAGESVDIFKLLVGNIGGTIGETSAIALLIGACYLVGRKVISLRIPLTYILTTVIFVLIFGGKGFDTQFLLGHVLGGGLLLGAFFMATDYVTSPVTPKGKIVFGIFLGLMTGLFRIVSKSAEGVSYAILLGNMLVPLINKATLPRAFGVGKERVKNEK
ncbi:MAG TPA: RnfABCDGE type electron transport complex subunit D [Mobilitalea sp.]|nr:RnfABCDGE type electron transport complex subunit D [Mobilitalea sp.]